MIDDTIEQTPTDDAEVNSNPKEIESRVVCLDAVMQLYSRGTMNFYDRTEEDE